MCDAELIERWERRARLYETCANACEKDSPATALALWACARSISDCVRDLARRSVPPVRSSKPHPPASWLKPVGAGGLALNVRG